GVAAACLFPPAPGSVAAAAHVSGTQVTLLALLYALLELWVLLAVLQWRTMGATQAGLVLGFVFLSIRYMRASPALPVRPPASRCGSPWYTRGLAPLALRGDALRQMPRVIGAHGEVV